MIPESLIEAHFNSKMKSDQVPLLRSFEVYSEHLPVREDAEKIILLYKREYFARSEDLIYMAKRIMEEQVARNIVPYLAAPTKSGKSASVLPAFLASTNMTNGGTHYFYLAFSNNKGRCFKLDNPTPSENELVAEEQGAAFILECVKRLVEIRNDFKIPLNRSPPLWEDSVQLLNQFLQDKLGKEAKIWFHLDEHYRMCKRDADSKGAGASFSRGAMSALAAATNVRVIATFTERPLSISPESSPLVCR